MRVQAPRIVGIDVARGFAVLGMFIAHTYPNEGDAELIVDGRSAILFATLAGVSLGLLTGGDDPARSLRPAARSGVAIRAAFLFLLGTALTVLPSHIAIILDFYGVMFALMIPVLFLPRLALGVIAAALAIAAPLVATWAAAGEHSGWAELAAYYLLLGSYPALVWLPFLLIGLLCTRFGLTRPATQRWMMLGGAAAMLLGYGSAYLIGPITAEAHSGSTAEIVGSGGFAIALIGALLWLERFRAARIGFYPIAATGSMPLTIYTLQILLLAGCVAFAERAPWVPDYPGLPLMFGLIIASLIFSMLWRHLIGAGPLERLLRYLAGFDRANPERSRRG